MADLHRSGERSREIVQKKGTQDGEKFSRTGSKDDAGDPSALGC